MRGIYRGLRSRDGQRPRSRIATTGGILAMLVVFGALYQPVVVQGRSMLPSLHDGEVIWMNRQRFRHHAAQRGDIVIFRLDRCVYVKRVYARGGELVRLTSSMEGIPVLLEDAARPRGIDLSPLPVQRVRVPRECLYVVGDNRADSMDSRDFGPIPERSVIGYIPSKPPAALQRVARGTRPR